MRMHETKTAKHVWFPSARPQEPETCELTMKNGPSRTCTLGDGKLDDPFTRDGLDVEGLEDLAELSRGPFQNQVKWWNDEVAKDPEGAPKRLKFDRHPKASWTVHRQDREDGFFTLTLSPLRGDPWDSKVTATYSSHVDRPDFAELRIEARDGDENIDPYGSKQTIVGEVTKGVIRPESIEEYYTAFNNHGG